jgi:aspartyl-tRNA(Asn)/glutamyl-tRNA(Gln) amidotransferase subunit A
LVNNNILGFKMKPLHELSNDLATGKVTARDLAEQALANIADESGEGARAFLRVDADAVRADADHMDGLRVAGRAPSPFAGIPMSLKDLFDVAGEVTSAGSVVLRDAPPAKRDATTVARLKGAGFVNMGRTNMTEFAYSGVGLNPHYGTPASVWDRETRRIPGGSSSGAAVSIADNMAALAMGTDTGGSCRVPAAFNKVVGVKPTTGRIPTTGVYPLSASLDAPGPFGKTVGCCAAADAILAEDWNGVPAPRDTSSLRFGVLKTIVHDNLDAHVGSALEAAYGELSAAGVSLVDVALPALEGLPAMNAKGGLAAAEAFALHKAMLASDGDKYDQRVATRIGSGALQSADELIDILNFRKDLVAASRAAMFGFDAFIMATVPIVPPAIAELDRDEDYARINLQCLRNTFIGNFLDTCAISMPIGDPDGPPVGLMLMAPGGADHAMFAAAAVVEAVLKQ